MYLNARRHMAALGIQSMFLPTSYGGASIEWVNTNMHETAWPKGLFCENWWYKHHVVSKNGNKSIKILSFVNSTLLDQMALLGALWSVVISIKRIHFLPKKMCKWEAIYFIVWYVNTYSSWKKNLEIFSKLIQLLHVYGRVEALVRAPDKVHIFISKVPISWPNPMFDHM